MRFRKEWFKTRHLRVGQPEKIANVSAPFSEPRVTQRGGNQCIPTLGWFALDGTSFLAANCELGRLFVVGNIVFIDVKPISQVIA